MIPDRRDKILVISPMVPRPDVNSGDLRLFTMLEILAREWQVFFVSTACNPGDEPYVSLLERRGILVYRQAFSLRQLLGAETFRLALLEFYTTAEYYLERIRILQPHCPVVVDSVDVHFLRLKMKHDLTGDEEDLKAWRSTRQAELAVYAKADAVITVTGDDAAALQEAGITTECHVVPNIHQPCPGSGPFQRDSLIFVGGFAHAPNVDAVQYFCGQILPLIRSARPRARLTVVGSQPPPEILGLAGEAVTVTGFVPETTPYLHASHVSVAPLRFGAGMKGKIGEAMAHGVPVVTTSVGAQGMGLEDRVSALIADPPERFAAAVLELLADDELHQSIRSSALALIAGSYTPERVGRRLLDALAAIVARPAKRMKISEKLLFINGYFTSRVRAGLTAGD